VEIHQMTLSALIGRHWTSGICAPFYPMVFVYLQWSALKLGATDLGSVVSRADWRCRLLDQRLTYRGTPVSERGNGLYRR
jgi:hypothetical protein